MPSLRSIRHISVSAPAAWALIFIFFALVEWPCARMCCDDWRFAFVCQGADYLGAGTPGAIPVYEPVRSGADLLRSVATHTLTHNGRAEVHLLVQGFAALWGYGALALFVALVSTAAVEFVSRLSTAPGCRVSFLRRMAALAAFCVVMPWFGVFRSWFGGAAFSLNYALPSALMLGALWLMRRGLTLTSPSTRGQCAGYAAAGLLAGLSHEGFAIPLTAALLWMLWRHRRGHRSVPRRSAWLFAGTVAGTVAVCVPSLTNRFQTHIGAADTGRSALLRALNDMASVSELFAVIAVALTAAIVLIALPSTRSRARRACRQSAPYALAAAVSVAMIFILCLTSIRLLGSTRQLLPAGVMLWLIAMIWASDLITPPRSRSVRRFVVAILAIGTGASAWAWHADASESRSRYDALLEAYLDSPDGTVVIPDNPYTHHLAPGLAPALPVPAPVGAAHAEYFERQFISEHFAPTHRPLRFRPDITSPSDAEMIFTDSAVTLYSRPGAWWIIATGVGPDTRAYAWRAQSLRPLRRLLSKRYLLPDHDETALYTDTLCFGGSRGVLIGRAPDLESDTLMLLRADGSINLYPVCAGLQGK